MCRSSRTLCLLTSIVVMLIGSSLPSIVAAQGGTASATIAGRIVDETGGALPGVVVTIVNTSTNQVRTTVTNDGGVYRFSGLQPSTYSVKTELQGFRTVTVNDIALNVGAAADLNVTMKLSQFADTVNVSADTVPIVETKKTDLSTVIAQKQIETLPTSSRNFLDFVLLTPASVENTTTTSQGIGLNIGGARAKEASLLVDGFWNTDESFTFPRFQYSPDAVQEFQVVSLGATAEFGRAIGGVVNAVTKSGGNTLRGTSFLYYRNTNLNAQTVLEKQRGTAKSAFDKKQYGGTIGGPLLRDRTFYFASIERTVQNTPVDNNITSANAAAIGLPNEDVGSLPAHNVTTFAMAKVTHTLNQNNSLEGTFVFTRNNAVEYGAFGTRSRGLRDLPIDFGYQFKWTGIGKNGRWFHELKASYFPRHYTFDGPNVGGPPLTPDGQLRATKAPSVSITGVANFGGGQINNDQFTYPVQAIYTSSLSKGNHAIKFGSDVMLTKFDYVRTVGIGSYSFRSLATYLQGQYSTFTETFGDPLIKRFHTYVSTFIQDSWDASPRLTINYGLRYDLEVLSKYRGHSYGSDRNNVGPRFAVSYDLTGKGTTLAKISSGIYYDRIFQNPMTPTFYGLKDVLQQVSVTWLYGQTGAPVYPQAFTELPSNAPNSIRNVYIVPNNMQVPASFQLVASLDHAFTRNMAVTASFLFNRSWNKEMLFDRNLTFDEATQKWIRPDPNYRSISQYNYSARARYTGFVLEVRQRAREKVNFSANFTYSKAYDMGNNFSTPPNDQRYPDREWGPSADVPTVRVAASGSYEINRHFLVSWIYRGRSGYAYDPRSGNTYDLNGDGQFNDRTPGFARNAFRGPGTHSLDARFAWTTPIGKRRFQVLIESFNLLNRANVRTEYSTYGPNSQSPDPLFMTPTGYFAPREVQLGVRFEY